MKDQQKHKYRWLTDRRPRHRRARRCRAARARRRTSTRPGLSRRVRLFYSVSFIESILPASDTFSADLPLWHPLTRDPSRSSRVADIGVGAMGPRFRRDLEAIAYYWAGRRTPPGPIRPGYGALNFQNVPLIAPSK